MMFVSVDQAVLAHAHVPREFDSARRGEKLEGVHPYRSPASPPASARKVERGCYVRIIEGGRTGIVLFLRGRHVHVKLAGVPPRYECFRQSELECLG